MIIRTRGWAEVINDPGRDSSSPPPHCNDTGSDRRSPLQVGIRSEGSAGHSKDVRSGTGVAAHDPSVVTTSLRMTSAGGADGPSVTSGCVRDSRGADTVADVAPGTPPCSECGGPMTNHHYHSSAGVLHSGWYCPECEFSRWPEEGDLQRARRLHQQYCESVPPYTAMGTPSTGTVPQKGDHHPLADRAKSAVSQSATARGSGPGSRPKPNDPLATSAADRAPLADRAKSAVPEDSPLGTMCRTGVAEAESAPPSGGAPLGKIGSYSSKAENSPVSNVSPEGRSMGLDLLADHLFEAGQDLDAGSFKEADKPLFDRLRARLEACLVSLVNAELRTFWEGRR